MSIFNPLNAGPTQPTPYQQPSTSAPASNSAVASYAVGANVLNISEPVAKYLQPGVTLTSPLPAWVNSGGAGPTA